MEIFSSNLKFRDVELRTAADIVQHSFIVQNSISPLNLELCQSHILWDEQMDCDLPSSSYPKDLINTEEKCLKVLTSSRSLLYTLDLDFPKQKERSLRSDWITKNGSHNCRESHTAKICIEDSFYTNVLYDLVDYACNRSDDNLKILKWFIKFDVLVKPDVPSVPSNIINHIVDCMHPGLNDSEFVKDCFKKLGINLTDWSCSSDSLKPGRRINFLYQFHRTGRNYKNMIWYKDTYSPRKGVLYNYVDDDEWISGSPETSRRLFLMMQLLYCFIEKFRDPLGANEFFRVVWNSLPDSFLSSKEILAAFEEECVSQGAKDAAPQVCNYYSETVGGLQSYVEPRSLKHYCRTTIRKELAENAEWVPDAIKELGLPKKLQAYLNLDAINLNPFLVV